jgi:diguanylate cyclase (GGDEF)-like protein
VKVAERIRQRIHDLKIEHTESPVSKYVTASFGVTTVRYSLKSSPMEIIAFADKLLYKAKVSGRDMIEYTKFRS